MDDGEKNENVAEARGRKRVYESRKIEKGKSMGETKICVVVKVVEGGCWEEEKWGLGVEDWVEASPAREGL